MKNLIQISQRYFLSVIFIAIIISGIFLAYFTIRPNYDDEIISINTEKNSEEQTKTFGVLKEKNIHGKKTFTDLYGNIYIAGYFSGTIDIDPSDKKFEIIGNDYEIFLAKYDPFGRLIWGKSIGGPGKDAIHAMKGDESGNVILVGYIENEVKIDTEAGVKIFSANGIRDSFVAKFDLNGEFLWGHSFGGLDDDKACPQDLTHYDEGLDLDIDKLGNIYVVGRFNGVVNLDSNSNQLRLSSEGTDGYVAKYSSDGAILWAFRIGGSGFDQVRKVTSSIDDRNIYISGTYEQSVDFDPSNASVIKSIDESDVFICKYNDEGKYLWCETLKGTGQEYPHALGEDTCDIF